MAIVPIVAIVPIFAIPTAVAHRFAFPVDIAVGEDVPGTFAAVGAPAFAAIP